MRKQNKSVIKHYDVDDDLNMIFLGYLCGQCSTPMTEKQTGVIVCPGCGFVEEKGE